MFWYYEMVQLHVLLVAASGLLFGLRGLAMLLGSAWAMDDRVRTLGGGLDFMLSFVGLCLWGLLGLNPLVYPWLISKFLLLAAYIGLANLTLRYGQSTELRLLGYVLGLAAFGLMVQVSRTKDAFAGF